MDLGAVHPDPSLDDARSKSWRDLVARYLLYPIICPVKRGTGSLSPHTFEGKEGAAAYMRAIEVLEKDEDATAVKICDGEGMIFTVNRT